MSVLYSQVLHFIWSGTLLKNTGSGSGESLALWSCCPQKVLAGCQPGPGFPSVPCLGYHRARGEQELHGISLDGSWELRFPVSRPAFHLTVTL